MRPWPRLIGRLLIIFLWLFLISLPMLAFLLAARQEVTIGTGENHVRIFLLSEADKEGIGLELTRPFASAASCTRTTVNYFMWVGEPDNVTFCDCVDPQTGFSLPLAPDECGPP